MIIACNSALLTRRPCNVLVARTATARRRLTEALDAMKDRKAAGAPQHAPALIEFRKRSSSRAAIVFVHGFSGSPKETWEGFPHFLEEEESLRSWDVFSLGYSTSLRVDVPNIWAADPPLGRLSLSLRSALQVPPLSGYDALALVAHSMGGLIVQHALLDRQAAKAVTFVALFGTPSGGLYKAIAGLPLKRQARDMFPFSPFMLALRWRWRRHFGRMRPFELRVIAGETDEFVPPRSSLSPFSIDVQRVVPGNHLGIVKPSTRQERSVQLVVELLAGTGVRRTLVDTALLAVERREFNTVVDQLLPAVGELDDIGVIALALALEGLGRSQEAIDVLQEYCAERT